MSNSYGPSFTAAKLYRKPSKNGGTYFTGRMGGVKVALLKSKDTTDDGEEVWNLVFSEAAPYQPRDTGTDDAKPAPSRTYGGSSRARRDYAAPLSTADRAAGPRSPVPPEYMEIPSFE
jgi:hypothetical protein